MSSFRSRPIGWRYESQRHSLAAKGVATKRYDAKREFPASPAIGQHGYGTIVGAYRNARAEQERKRIIKALTAGEDLGARAKFESQRVMSQTSLTPKEKQLQQYKLAAAFAPAREHAARLLYVPIWRKDLKESAEKLEKLQKKFDEIQPGKKAEGDVKAKAELRKEVRTEYKKFKRAREKLESIREPDVAEVLGKMELYEKTAQWASRQSRAGRKHTVDRTQEGKA